ncbi:MAG TPA: hypothetical protein VK447_11635 [Myxococcaceae bacterium]|nr:hypothetical protein [Myxococcaceae bacterium]
MSPRSSSLLTLSLLALCACGPSQPAVDGLDTSRDGIARFLREDSWRSWTGDAQPRAPLRNSPHGFVRVFFNPKLEASLRTNALTHPVGSIAVKESYASDGVTVAAQLLEVKVAEGAAKDTWLYFEATPPDYRQPYYGRGIQVCTGCHVDGRDFVISPLP